MSVADLSDKLQVAEATIRRDLDALEADGVLKRYHGGACLDLGSSYEPPFTLREMTNTAAKQAIASAVAEQVSDGDTIVLDGGSTGLAVAEALAQRAVTICPLSLRIAWALAASQTVNLLIPGGAIRKRELSIVGAEATEYLRMHRFDKYIATASGMSAKVGLTEWNPEDAAVKRAALESAETTIAAVDASKYGKIGFVKFCEISRPELIVTDDRLPDDGFQTVKAAGGKLVTIAVDDLG